MKAVKKINIEALIPSATAREQIQNISVARLYQISYDQKAMASIVALVKGLEEGATLVNAEALKTAIGLIRIDEVYRDDDVLELRRAFVQLKEVD